MIYINEIIEAHYDCQYKCWLKRMGREGKVHPLQKQYADHLSTIRRAIALERYNAEFPLIPNNIEKVPASDDGWVILHVSFTWQEMPVMVDILQVKKLPDKSLTLVPTIIIPFCRIDQKYKLLMGFILDVLREMTEMPVLFGEIIYSDDWKRCRIKRSTYEKKVGRVKQFLTTIKEPFFFLNHHCAYCEFREECREKATTADHLSLLKGMGPDGIIKNNRKGIFTVQQLSFRFRPKRKVNKKAVPVRLYPLQALALREQKIFVCGELTLLPDAKCKIFLDVEGIPDEKSYYLVGVIVEDDEKVWRQQYWIDRKDDLIDRMKAFVTSFDNVENYTIYHYGSFEIDFFKHISRLLGDPYRVKIQRLVDRCHNLLSDIYGRIYFPVYSNSLKEIGATIGCEWTLPATGLDATHWRREWERDKGDAWKEQLLTYNYEDCLALQKLKETLDVVIAGQNLPMMDTRKVDELVKERHAMFTLASTFFPELKFINKCAYFNYQKNHCKARQNEVSKVTVRPKREKPHGIFDSKVNREIAIAATNCEKCQSAKIKVIQKLKRKLADLDFTSAAIRQTNVKYFSGRYKCLECGHIFIPKKFPPFKLRIGRQLICWVIYHHFTNNQSFRQIRRNFYDFFGLPISKSTLFFCKKYFMQFYEKTYQELYEAILESPVLYVDETPFSLQFSKGYVWVLTNGAAVVSIFRETREATFIIDLLKDFKGVLVTDFYAGYDSIKCPQQKCLIHLIRDLNTDLVRNPYNDELKEIIRRFSSCLKPIIHTIDQRGLKKYFLRKHLKEVDRFFLNVGRDFFKSDIAVKYQSRLAKNKNKLFQFLYHDNVSWHNNYAEHAIKIISANVNKDRNAFRETMIGDYCRIMSIYQTCEFMDISFWKFLLSGKTSLLTFRPRKIK